MQQYKILTLAMLRSAIKQVNSGAEATGAKELASADLGTRDYIVLDASDARGRAMLRTAPAEGAYPEGKPVRMFHGDEVTVLELPVEHPLWAKVAFVSERRPDEMHQGYVKRKHLRSFFEAASQKTPKQWIRDAKQRAMGNFDEKELQHLDTQVLYDMYVAAKPGGGTGMAAWKQYSEDIKREKCLMFLCDPTAKSGHEKKAAAAKRQKV